jgi:hypothetical protein
MARQFLSHVLLSNCCRLTSAELRCAHKNHGCRHQAIIDEWNEEDYIDIEYAEDSFGEKGVAVTGGCSTILSYAGGGRAHDDYVIQGSTGEDLLFSVVFHTMEPSVRC